MNSYCVGDVIKLNPQVCGGRFISACIGKYYCPSSVNAFEYLPISPTGEVGPLPDTLCKGVNTLIIKTGCGCYSTKVNLICNPPVLDATSIDSNIRQAVDVCCDEV